MNIILYVLLIILLMLQIIVLLYTLIGQIRRNKEERKLWTQMNEAIKNQVKRYNDLYPDEPLQLNEDTKNEQNK